MNALRGASLPILVQAMIYSQDHDMQSNNNIYFLREELQRRPVHEPLGAASCAPDVMPAGGTGGGRGRQTRRAGGRPD